MLTDTAGKNLGAIQLQKYYCMLLVRDIEIRSIPTRLNPAQKKKTNTHSKMDVNWRQMTSPHTIHGI